jgi:hypothetical protein
MESTLVTGRRNEELKLLSLPPLPPTLLNSVWVVQKEKGKEGLSGVVFFF